jgi:hypothetical protein
MVIVIVIVKSKSRTALNVAETTGARSLMIIFRLLTRQTRLPGATDNTSRRYGDSARAARPARSFLTHHIHKPTSVISTAIQAADARWPTPKPSSTPPARACSARSHMGSTVGSCKVCVF